MSAAVSSSAPPRPRWRLNLVAIAILLFLFLAEELLIALIVKTGELPDLSVIKNYEPALVTEVYGRSGDLLTTYSSERRRLVTLEEVPSDAVRAILAAEDAEFYSHHGLDFEGIGRAAIANVERGRVSQGGSTITQQVVRLTCLTPERTFLRKVREAILARRLERKTDKQSILTAYLNLVYFGAGAHGIEEAARTYFGVDASELSLAQAAMLAASIQSPSRVNPERDFPAAKLRQEWVLDQMAEKGFLTPAAAEKAKAAPVWVKQKKEPPKTRAPFFLDAVKQEFIGLFGEEELEKGGYRIYTGLDLGLQEEAERAVRAGLEKLDSGLAGGNVRPLDLSTAEKARLMEEAKADYAEAPPGEGDEVKALIVGSSSRTIRLLVGGWEAEMPFKGTPWKPGRVLRRKKRRLLPGNLPEGEFIRARVIREHKGKLLLAPAGEPSLEAALVAIDPQTREVRAMVGGYDFERSQFNRAMQSKRPPGSAMKPIVYGAAFRTREWTMASIIDDEPFALRTETGFWRPENYSGGHYGLTTLYEALVHSRNVVTVRLANEIGVGRVIEYARALGITEPFQPDLALALGAQGISVLEMVNAYAVFAARGIYEPPKLITRVEDRHGRVVYEAPSDKVQALSEAEAFLVTFVLEHVITSGTGGRARAIGRRAAGKTGTTSDYRDNWFIGYTPSIVTGVWVGRDDFTPIGRGVTGGKGALPIWVDFMKAATRDAPKEWYKAPEDVYFSSVVAVSREPKSRRTAEAQNPEESPPKRELRLCFLKGTRTSLHRPALLNEPPPGAPDLTAAPPEIADKPDAEIAPAEETGSNASPAPPPVEASFPAEAPAPPDAPEETPLPPPLPPPPEAAPDKPEPDPGLQLKLSRKLGSLSP